MFKRFGVLVAIVSFAMSACPANAITIPINENAGAPAVATLQKTVAEFANGAAQIVTSIEAAVGRIVGQIADRLAGLDPSGKTLSYAASAATPVAATAVVANTAVEPVASISPGSAPLPPATTTVVIVEKEQPVVEAAPSITTAQFNALLGSLRDLLVLLPETASSASGGGSADFTTTEQEIAALQREVAQTNQINSLSNVTLSSPTIVSPSIAGLSTSQVSEGSNLYFTTARVASYIESSSTIPSVAGGALGNVLSWNGFAWVATATSSLGVLGSQWTALGNTLSYTSGNVGIGTTSPSALLTIDSSNATGTILRISNSSTGGHVFDLLSTGSGNTNGAGRLDIFDSTAGQARLSIAANGNVGIGTTSPFAAFAVTGNAFLSGNLNVGDPTTTRSNLGLAYATATNLTTIVTWGDSLTYGSGGTSYPSQLANLLGVPVYNGGVNALTSAQIATLMLAAPSMYSDPTIIWAGRNDITGNVSTDEPIIDANIASMVSALQSAGNTHYLVMSIINSNTEPSGSINYNEIIQINTDLATTYASHYWDVRSYLVSLYNPSLPQDVIDYGNDVPPSSLRAEPLHPNTAGNLKIAQYLQQHSNLLISPLPSTAVLTTQNLSLLLSNPFSFSSLDTVSGYTQGGNVVLSLFPNDQSLAVGAASAAAWMTATSSYFYDTALGIGALKAAPTSGMAVDNTAIGANTLSNNTSGNYNTASGEGGLYNNTSGSLNTANGVLALYYNTTGSNNTELGVGSLYKNTTGSFNVAVGVNVLQANTTGSTNVGVGYQALLNATSTSNNTAVGNQAMGGSTTGSLTISGTNNVAVGLQALTKYIDGSNNVAMGYQSMVWATTSKNSVAIGYSAGVGNSTNDNYQGLVALGYQSGHGLANGSDYNTLVGYQAGYGITTGNNNVWIGTATSSTAIANLTTGSQNILIGNNISLASSTASGQINIGNILFGTGITGTGSKLSTGNVAIGTTTPYSRLEVWGPDTASTSAFAVVNSASTTEFTVYDTGNATLAGSLVQNSDERLKTNIQDLDGSSSLAEIEALNPVTFNWIDPAKSSVPQYGFIAQQVQSVLPNLVSVTAPTALTPDGTLSLNYIDLLSPIVAAIQELDKEITSLASAVAGFAESFTTKQLTFVRGQGNEIDVQTANVQKLCIGSTCVTEAQLQALLASANQSSAAPSPSSEATDTPPVIAINGDNPAVVQVGASYSDLGAIITGPQADLNLGIKTFVNGLFVSNIQLDTSAAATDTIDYVLTDQNGLSATSTRTVIIQAANDNQSSSTPANDNAPATTTTATSAS